MWNVKNVKDGFVIKMMSTKDYEKRIEKDRKNVPPGYDWYKAYGTFAIAHGLLAIASALEKLTEVIKEK